jgi:hypothetical protein
MAAIGLRLIPLRAERDRQAAALFPVLAASDPGHARLLFPLYWGLSTSLRTPLETFTIAGFGIPWIDFYADAG